MSTDFLIRIEHPNSYSKDSLIQILNSTVFPVFINLDRHFNKQCKGNNVLGRQNLVDFVDLKL